MFDVILTKFYLKLAILDIILPIYDPKFDLLDPNLAMLEP